jgi:hypothetical protein
MLESRVAAARKSVSAKSVTQLYYCNRLRWPDVLRISFKYYLEGYTNRRHISVYRKLWIRKRRYTRIPLVET